MAKTATVKIVARAEFAALTNLYGQELTVTCPHMCGAMDFASAKNGAPSRFKCDACKSEIRAA